MKATLSLAALLPLACLAGCLGDGGPPSEEHEYLDDRVTRERVEAAFERLPDELFGDVSVTVRDGVVVLSGSVPSEGARERAEAVALDRHRVGSIENRLRVEPRSSE